MRGFIISHGFDSNNKELEETISASEWSEKLISIDRIKSVTEKFILMDYAHGRWIYWEYQGGLALMKQLLKDELEGST